MRQLAVPCAVAAALCLAPADAELLPLDLELILAIDTSPSVDGREYALQARGLAAAFRSADVIAAIEAGAGVAVCVVQWSEAGQNRIALDWTALHRAADARVLAERLNNMPRHYVAGATAIGSAIFFATRLFDTNGFEASRHTIDVSGDGHNNEGLSVAMARERAAAGGITINGLATLTEDPWLDRYYLQNVIGGPEAFVVSATDYEAFAAAIRAKLVREIGGFPVASHDRPGDEHDRHDAPVRAARIER